MFITHQFNGKDKLFYRTRATFFKKFSIILSTPLFKGCTTAFSGKKILLRAEERSDIIGTVVQNRGYFAVSVGFRHADGKAECFILQIVACTLRFFYKFAD